jgi:hypothetical protein
MCNISDLFGGPSQQEEGIANSTQSFSNSLQANYGQAFGQQQSTLTGLNNEIQKIETGQTGQGFSAQELAAKNTQAIDSAGAASRNAQQAIGNFTAGEGGGGGSGIVSGVQEQLRAGAASSSANELATAQNNIVQQNYAQGRTNAAETVGGLTSLASEYGGEASSAMGGAINEGNAAFSESDKIQQQKAQEMAGIGSLVGSVAGAVVPGAGMLSSLISHVDPNADTGLLDTIAGG